MSALQTFSLTVAIVVVAKTVAWLLQLRLRNAGLVDAIWAWTLGLLALVYAVSGTAPLPSRVALALMGGGWGLRLGTYLWLRNFGRPEDWRYAQFRSRWGASADRNMFWFFQFQNVFTLLLSASAFLPTAYRSGVAPVWSYAAAGVIWLVAVLGEGIADRQLEAFRRSPEHAGKVCRQGLWRYSRHPNYFFECVHWLAYVPLCWGSATAWGTLLSPLVMAFLLLKLSGVPMLEAGLRKRKPEYDEYVRTTSALIPWPPRR